VGVSRRGEGGILFPSCRMKGEARWSVSKLVPSRGGKSGHFRIPAIFNGLFIKYKMYRDDKQKGGRGLKRF
jgi:hypothetical protein